MALAGAAGMLALGGLTGLCAMRTPRRLPWSRPPDER